MDRERDRLRLTLREPLRLLERDTERLPDLLRLPLATLLRPDATERDLERDFLSPVPSTGSGDGERDLFVSVAFGDFGLPGGEGAPAKGDPAASLCTFSSSLFSPVLSTGVSSPTTSLVLCDASLSVDNFSVDSLAIESPASSGDFGCEVAISKRSDTINLWTEFHDLHTYHQRRPSRRMLGLGRVQLKGLIKHGKSN